MKVSDLLESRQANWRELEAACAMMERTRRRNLSPRHVARFGLLYRAACADLALAEAYRFPAGTIEYLHQLVGRAHNQLYRSRMFNFRAWTRQLLVEVPRRLFADNALRLAFVVFWGLFFLGGALAYNSTEFTERLVPPEMLMKMEMDFSEPLDRKDPDEAAEMGFFYIVNNVGVALRCFAFGLVFGIAGLFILVYNAAMIGAVAGYFATQPQSENFLNFVTAHGPFELTAIVLSAAAGMRLGFSLIDTRGYTRSAALRRAATEAMPAMGAAIVLLLLAALIEAFISPTAIPYAVKVLVALFSVVVLLFYFVVLGYPKTGESPD
jgi:uncharacterized membrane protein SpoIIM required for sporulation